MVTVYPDNAPYEKSQTPNQKTLLSPGVLLVSRPGVKFLGIRATQDVTG